MGTDTNSTVLAYLAGCIDSDGCITISRQIRKIGRLKTKRPSHAAKLQFTGTVNDVAHRLFKDTFGGSILYYRPRNPKHKEQIVWSSCNLVASAAVKRLIPYLLLKRRQGELLVEFSSVVKQQWEEIKELQIPPYRVTDSMVEIRDDYHRRVVALNSPRSRIASVLFEAAS